MWNFAAPLLTSLGLSFALPAVPVPLPQGAPQVEIRGTLHFVVENPDPRFEWAGFIGWRVTAGGKTYDLDLGNNPALQGSAKQLNGTTVVVRGTLREQTLAVGRRGSPWAPRPMDARLIELRVIAVIALRGADEPAQR